MDLQTLRKRLEAHYAQEAARAEAAAKARAEAEAKAKAAREAAINAKAAELVAVLDVALAHQGPMPVEFFRPVFGAFLDVIERRYGMTVGDRSVLENSIEGFELMRAVLTAPDEHLQLLNLTVQAQAPVYRQTYSRPADAPRKREPEPLKYDLPEGAVDLTATVMEEVMRK